MSLERIEWTDNYQIGINVIDNQHHRIIDYINTLVDMPDDSNKEGVAEIIDSMIDYTYSHFAFEEALMEEAGYEYLAVHKRTHDAFTQRIHDLHKRLVAGENIKVEIGEQLQTWLINHIMEDDKSYAPLVKQQLPVIENKDAGNWLSTTIKKFFSR